MDAAQLEADVKECRYEAKLAALGPARDRRYRSATDAAARGAAEGVSQAFRELEFKEACLEARGYSYERVP